MVNVPNLKAKTPVEAFEKAWAYIGVLYPRSELVQIMHRIKLKGYADGVFRLEAPAPYFAEVLQRHSERAIIQREIQAWVPDGVVVKVEVVVAEVEQS